MHAWLTRFRQEILFCVCGIALVCSQSAAAEWRQAELNILRSLSLSELRPLPRAPSNRVANDANAARLGEKLFFDTTFSKGQAISCATCHVPDKYFTDQRKVAIGLQASHRNTPTVVGSAWQRWFYWDGRRDSLWAQALIPFEAQGEMGSDRHSVVWRFGQNTEYVELYERLFGEFPTSLRSNAAPVQASPIGDAQTQDRWYRIPRAKQVQINTVFANLGKVIAAYERTLLPSATRFDRYVEQLLFPGRKTSDTASVSADEIAGMRLFIDPEKTQCLQCHNGALLTNGDFHNIGTGNFSGEHLDFGRLLGLQAVQADEFNCLGQYSDAHPKQCSQLRFLETAQHHVPLQGAFKTPSLRNLKLTPPYFHDGRFSELRDVLQHYNVPPNDSGNHELKALRLSDRQLDQLLAFLQMLSD